MEMVESMRHLTASVAQATHETGLTVRAAINASTFVLAGHGTLSSGIGGGAVTRRDCLHER